MLRLVLIVLFLLSGLLCVFPAPRYHLWYVSILVTEFPWIFLIIVSLLLFWGFTVKRFRAAGTLFGFAAFLLFLSPVIRAYNISEELDNNFVAAFGPGSLQRESYEEGSPFGFWQMISGIGEREFPYTTMVYSAGSVEQLTLDYYKPAMKDRRPCVVVVHGGSWSAGDSRQLPELNSYLAKAGYNVASINYRLVPKYIYPAPIEDVQAALSYLKARSGALNIDTTNFVLLGRSAGGQIVLNAAYTLHEPGIKGVIDFYGPADMVWGYANPANPLVLNTCKVMEDYLGGTYARVPHNYVASSATEITANVPTLMIHGKNDPLVAYGHSTRLSEKLTARGVKHFLLTLPWATHGCDYSLNGPSGQLSTYTIEQFLYLVTNKR